MSSELIDTQHGNTLSKLRKCRYRQHLHIYYYVLFTSYLVVKSVFKQFFGKYIAVIFSLRKPMDFCQEKADMISFLCTDNNGNEFYNGKKKLPSAQDDTVIQMQKIVMRCKNTLNIRCPRPFLGIKVTKLSIEFCYTKHFQYFSTRTHVPYDTKNIFAQRSMGGSSELILLS